MSSDPKNPEIGDLMIDASDLADRIVDLPPRAMLGLVGPRDGLDETLEEISANQPTDGARAGIADSLIDELEGIAKTIADIDNLLPAAQKLVELLVETRAKQEDDRYQIISTIASMVDRRAKKSGYEDLTALYERTLAYRSAVANKAAKTRAKNEAAAAETTTSPA